MSRIPGLHRLDLPLELPATGSTLLLEGTTAHHLLKVLRAKIDDQLQLTDGRGAVVTARLERIIERQQLEVVVTGAVRLPEPPAVTVVFPLIRRERMEWGMEKLAEIGVWRIIPCRFARSDSTRGQVRLNRLEQRLQEGCRQSGNPWQPELCPLLEFEELLCQELPQSDRLFWGAAEGSASITADEVTAKRPELLLLVGPEGGLSDKEEAHLRKLPDAEPLNLGRHTLRAETAAILLATRFCALSDPV